MVCGNKLGESGVYRSFRCVDWVKVGVSVACKSGEIGGVRPEV